MPDNLNPLPQAPSYAVESRADFIWKCYAHVVGAILAFAAIEAYLLTSGIAERIASSLIEQIAQSIRIESVNVAVSASIGIALYPENGTTAESLIRAADKAMYEVKNEGKNNFGFSGVEASKTA